MKPISAEAFLEALEYPSAALAKALGGGSLRFLRDANRQIIIHRRSTVLEARYEKKERQLLISAPLHEEAWIRCQQAAHLIRWANSPALNNYTRLPAGAQFGAPRQSYDLFLEELPKGVPLDQLLIEGCRGPVILSALKRLLEKLGEMGITHNNLKAENLIYTPDKEFVAIRPYLISFGEGNSPDVEACKGLQAQISNADSSYWLQALEEGVVFNDRSLPGAKWPSSEGLYLMREGRKYGYKESSGEWVIPPRYYRAENFREGRAEVRSSSGLGLIDKEGRYIISPHYKMIDYNELTGLCKAFKGEQWYYFDYMGQPISEEEYKNREKR